MKKILVAKMIILGLIISFTGGCVPSDDVVYTGPAPEVIAEDQEIVIAIGAEPENLDPMMMSSSPAATVAQHMVDSLIYLAPDGSLQPALAESWEPSEDGLSWTLILREGVSFHNGEPFNADAVKYNLDRFLGIGQFEGEDTAAFAFLLNRVTEIEVIDDYEVKLHLSDIFAPIASHLSHSFIGIHSPASLEALGSGEYAEKPVGTGPFKFQEWSRGEKIVMEKNEDYWGEAPVLDSVKFKFVPEGSARVMMLETGEADAIMAVPPIEIDRLDMDFDIDVVFQNSVRVIFLGLNMEREIFSDVRVRQALNYAINREAIIGSIFQGVGEPASAPVVPEIFGYKRVGPYEYNPDRARELLSDAGFEDGLDIDLLHPSGRYPQDTVVIEAIQDMLSEVNVNLKLSTMEWGSYVATLRVPPDEAQYDAHMLGWGTATLDADYGLFALFHSSQWPPAMNLTYYKNDRVDELLDEARISPDRAYREGLYHEAMEIIWNDAPWVFLYNEGQVNAVSRTVKGLVHHPLETLLAHDAYRVE